MASITSEDLKLTLSSWETAYKTRFQVYKMMRGELFHMQTARTYTDAEIKTQEEKCDLQEQEVNQADLQRNRVQQQIISRQRRNGYPVDDVFEFFNNIAMRNIYVGLANAGTFSRHFIITLAAKVAVSHWMGESTTEALIDIINIVRLNVDNSPDVLVLAVASCFEPTPHNYYAEADLKKLVIEVQNLDVRDFDVFKNDKMIPFEEQVRDNDLIQRQNNNVQVYVFDKLRECRTALFRLYLQTTNGGTLATRILEIMRQH